jgi:hypothetical protein
MKERHDECTCYECLVLEALFKKFLLFAFGFCLSALVPCPAFVLFGLEHSLSEAKHHPTPHTLHTSNFIHHQN